MNIFQSLKQTWQALRQRKWLTLAMDVALLVLVFQLFSAWQARDMLPKSQADAVPALELPDLSGQWHQLQAGQHQRTLVYFFAPWCTVCRFSVPKLNDLREKRSDSELAIYVVGLSYEDPQELLDFKNKHALKLPVLMGNKQTTLDWKIKGFPSYYVLDENGEIISHDIGLSTEWGMLLRTRT